MTLAGVKKGDIVECEVHATHFFALVASDGAIEDKFRKQRGLTLRPLTPRITYTFATAKQVVGHWRRSAKTPLKV